MNRNTLICAAAATVGVGTTLTLLLLVYRWLQQRKRCGEPQPGAWQRLGTLSEIGLYVLKSGAPLQLREAYCDVDGPSWAGLRDRRMVLLNDEGKVASAGVYPQMLTIRIRLLADGVLSFTAPEMETPLTLNVLQALENGVVTLEKQMPDYRLPLVECAPACHEWFSQALLQREYGFRLYIAKDFIRERHFWPVRDPFQPIMAMHEKSVADLNRRLAHHNQAHHHQFRGNLLIASDIDVTPFDEDTWLWLRFGEEHSDDVTILRFNSECLRCILVNVNVETGKRNANFEPLRTLKQYRLRSHPHEPAMGVYFDVLRAGRLRCGAAVYVQRRA